MKVEDNGVEVEGMVEIMRAELMLSRQRLYLMMTVLGEAPKALVLMLADSEMLRDLIRPSCRPMTAEVLEDLRDRWLTVDDEKGIVLLAHGPIIRDWAWQHYGFGCKEVLEGAIGWQIERLTEVEEVDLPGLIRLLIWQDQLEQRTGIEVQVVSSFTRFMGTATSTEQLGELTRLISLAVERRQISQQAGEVLIKKIEARLMAIERRQVGVLGR